MSFRNLILIITLLLIIYIVKVFCFPYETKYFEKAGVMNSHLYDDILKDKGKPLKEEVVEENANFVTKNVYYQGCMFYFLKSKRSPEYLDSKIIVTDPKNKTKKIFWITRPQQYMLYNIVITDKHYKLGFFKIGIGSSKEMVKLAYMGAKKQVEDNNGYIDGVTWVDFSYDKNDKVKQIRIHSGP